AGYYLRDSIIDDRPSETASEEFSLYWEVWNRVEDQFYGEIPESSNTTYGAIRGSLAALEDPYTLFIEPEPAAQEKAQLEGQFGGIGAFVRQDEEGHIILEPMRDRPAAQAGMENDDILVGVDGTEITTEWTVDEVVALIRGEVGTEVILSIRRGDDDVLELTIVRAIIETPSANWRLLEEDATIGYIQLTSFTERSNGEIEQALEELSGQGAESYIFDLRHNGGGLLDAAVDIASQFLSDGLVLKEDRKNEGERTYEVRSGGNALDQPMVLLINGGTASASEIVAGALQDQERATLIGEKSFGKGSVQLIYELSDSSRLHVTVANWFTPNGNAINGIGLTPDIEVLISEEDRANGVDPQFLRAIEFLQAGE
ncbi:MAG: S41 family peptidase, partial [Chloroflexota bacterium]